jgi:hypothetical protein
MVIDREWMISFNDLDSSVGYSSGASMGTAGLVPPFDDHLGLVDHP